MPPQRLQSEASHRARVSALVQIGVTQASRALAQRSFRALTSVLSILQFEAAQSGITAVEEMTDELEFDAPAVAAVVPSAFTGQTAAGGDVTSFLEAADSLFQLEMAMITEINDAARVAQEAAVIARTNLYGHIRVVNEGTCCGRCAVLAGKFYRWSEGFLRHPNCQCGMIPVLLAKDYGVMQDPMELFHEGRIHDLTDAETEAINNGADVSQVVNIRRKAAGLKQAGRVLERGNRLTVEGILQIASDREEVIKLLEQFGYLSR